MITNSKFVGMIAPHGGTLVDHMLVDAAAQSARERAGTLKRVLLSPMNRSDVEMIASGALSPLTGFMGHADYQSVVHHMHLANGLPWTIPVTLPVDADTASGIEIG